MMGYISWRNELRSVAASVAVVIGTTSALCVHAMPALNNSRSAGIEIGNGQLGPEGIADRAGDLSEDRTEDRSGDNLAEGEIALPKGVSRWTRRVSGSYTELIGPVDPQTSTSTKLRVKEIEQLDEGTVRELEEIGWKRFYWGGKDGVRLERVSAKNRALRSLEVKLFGETVDPVELVLIGTKGSHSFSYLYEWLTPKEKVKLETDQP
jgi:hypothetical protein